VVRYEDTFVRRTFANTDGSYITEERVYVGISLSATAKEGSNVQVGFDSVGDTRGFKGVQGLEGRVETVVKDAIDLLKAEKVPGGTYTVIADPRLAGVFAHEAFGHLSEADHVYENEKLREIMKLGERFGVPELSIVDDGTIFGERGYYKYDDEGVPSHKTYLIKDGLLVGRLHSRETAAQMGEAVTGNARAMNYRFQPIVRMSNTYIEPRNWKFNDMVADTENGIYAVSALGGQTELEMFTFSAAKAYLIKDGKIDRMLRDVILSGNIFETLKNIDAIGDDLSLYGGLGGCGKDSQWPLPVGDGSPHVRVRNVVIGGK
jgi:TldD protein